MRQGRDIFTQLDLATPTIKKGYIFQNRSCLKLSSFDKNVTVCIHQRTDARLRGRIELMGVELPDDLMPDELARLSNRELDIVVGNVTVMTRRN